MLRPGNRSELCAYEHIAMAECDQSGSGPARNRIHLRSGTSSTFGRRQRCEFCEDDSRQRREEIRGIDYGKTLFQSLGRTTPIREGHGRIGNAASGYRGRARNRREDAAQTFPRGARARSDRGERQGTTDPVWHGDLWGKYCGDNLYAKTRCGLRERAQEGESHWMPPPQIIIRTHQEEKRQTQPQTGEAGEDR